MNSCTRHIVILSIPYLLPFFPLHTLIHSYSKNEFQASKIIFTWTEYQYSLIDWLGPWDVPINNPIFINLTRVGYNTLAAFRTPHLCKRMWRKTHRTLGFCGSCFIFAYSRQYSCILSSKRFGKYILHFHHSLSHHYYLIELPKRTTIMKYNFKLPLILRLFFPNGSFFAVTKFRSVISLCYKKNTSWGFLWYLSLKYLRVISYLYQSRNREFILGVGVQPPPPKDGSFKSGMPPVKSIHT